MNIVFYLVGVVVLINAFMSGSQAQSAVHQIYIQLMYLTSIILIGFGHVFTCLNNKNEKIERKNLPSEEERKAFEKQQIENLNK